jgi:hypothetical protein
LIWVEYFVDKEFFMEALGLKFHLKLSIKTQSRGDLSYFQKLHPFVGRFVIAAAASEGELYFLPLYRIEPSFIT